MDISNLEDEEVLIEYELLTIIIKGDLVILNNVQNNGNSVWRGMDCALLFIAEPKQAEDFIKEVEQY